MSDAPNALLLRDPAVIGGMALLLAGASYGAIEVTRRIRHRAPLMSLSLDVLLAAAVLLTSGILLIDGLRARKRSVDTRIIEELRVIDGAIATPVQQPAPNFK